MNLDTNLYKTTTYAEHYRACQGSYSGPIDNSSHHSSVYDCVHDEDIFEVDSEFDDLVQRISNAVSNRFDYNIGCQWHKTHVELTSLTGIAEISDLAEVLIPQIERKIYRSHVVVHYADIKRNLPRRGMVNIPLGSWMWHYDDAPDESIKLILYLSEVSAIDGPLQVLQGPNVSRVRYPSSRIGPSIRETEMIKYPRSRIPPEIVDLPLEILW